MKVVITYGTFDLFHVGHIRLLKRLQSLGDKLVVGLSTDEFNRKKGKQSFFSYNERSEILRSCKYVDDVFPEENWDQKKDDILKYKANIFAMGDDWKGKFDELNDICEVVYLPRTKEISTTEIKRKLSTIKGDDLDKIENSLHTVIEIVKSLK
ncbi:glycerol-3-phosphate cytidylyltransferase [Vibrio parahaemolyticus]|uniref:Glycerol-3-phosphate cytidylyltransferase n=1 Tax=Vibrio parahaemolyticus TaxID=670 RepID=A0A5P5X5J8_VIBPH|nr:glycerol-3-phosphate cytidylyltransferase [Vibrio parahaemolyticus]EGQ7899946.1 glycerol-3-phosphate cytidylyltransferase [Vibrio parahaemolyticus]EGQ9495110.1 glycerol-3-phosphate cytidylyltransferase [Vibrio parahaemolyticus]EGQ9504474.1 glycerol-3-phosphate cytidylyltransferase [Vibrio parahaemolyticus]EGQ9814294.1 glycerol-3-phosphate cytidylyltransferase [Vibrio parahaemolyticus]EGR1670298.1 glycerol-3-phosphate cytidylyltransferase [Vibrio parahaemolyticus]